ncbi:MAG: diaminopimelate epimerase [Pyrinomonadaceae bacterium]
MSFINFCKFHGFGNDYIVFEAEDLHGFSSIENFARKVCHRKTGIGGDGIVVLEKLQSDTAADYLCRIVNPDGSEAGFSGNGTRCAIAYLYYKNLFAGENLKLKTQSGIKNYQFLERKENTFWFCAEIGKPKFPQVVSYDLQSANYEKKIQITELNVGNPVAVVFVANFDEMNWRAVGKELEMHSRFPEKTNVVFVKNIDRENIEIRIWERGAGETSSSGTCSIAAAVASVLNEKTESKISVHAKGGTTEAVWREDDEMLITGRADLAFCGEIYI